MTFSIQINDEIRQANAEEIALIEKIQNEAIQAENEKAEKATKREAALTKLAALGLDEDDLKALGL